MSTKSSFFDQLKTAQLKIIFCEDLQSIVQTNLLYFLCHLDQLGLYSALTIIQPKLKLIEDKPKMETEHP